MTAAMNLQFKDTIGKLKQKYPERKKQFPPSEDMTAGPSDEPTHVLASRSIRPSIELECYSKAIHELLTAVTNHPGHSDCSLDGNQDLSRESAAAALLQDSQGLFTETDVTLPSYLNASPGSTETDRKLQRARQLSHSCHCQSSSFAPVNVYREMMTIHEQLKVERQSQQQWEKELQEQERRLNQQRATFGRLAGLEEMLHAHILAVEEKHQQEVSQLQDLLQERSKENRRLRTSFSTIKELNDNMRKQLNEISEQNKRLESHSKRLQARLENLQRKHEHSTASRGCVKSSECIKPPKTEKTAATGKPSNKLNFNYRHSYIFLPDFFQSGLWTSIHQGSSSSTQLKLLAILMDWIIDGQTFSSVAESERKGATQCLPPEVALNERCLKVLPLLADQLHHGPIMSEPDLLLNLLRLIHQALRHMDSSTQPVALSSTLRRIGEAVSKNSVHSTISQTEDPDVPKSSNGAVGGACRSWTLCRRPCPHTRILSTLIMLRTVTQADVLALALDTLHTELTTVESRGLFIHYGGVRALLSMLLAGRGGLSTLMDILMQLTEQSRYLNPFLDACGCEEFFRTASQVLENPRLELPSLEKLSILLQKLSCVRKNRRLFEASSLRLQIQDLHCKTDHGNSFLCLNLGSILHNLK